MGINGLSSYVNKTGGLLRVTQLEETKIVIDGSSLLWELYMSEGIDYQHGGNYDQLADVMSQFFEALEYNGVEPYVVIDGPTGAKDKKLETIEMRFKEQIEKSYKLSKGHVDKDCFLLPLMAKGVFIQELTNLGIPFVVCDCEADQEVASLAKHWNYPVVSNDSDYFIFDLPAGYIPLKSLDWKGKSIIGKLYDRQRLADHLQIRPEFLPLVASLLGNDFIEDSTLAPFQNALFSGRRGKHLFCKKISAIVELLFSSQNLEAALECALVIISGESNRTRLRAAIKESIKEYSICDFTLNEFFGPLRQIRTSLKTMNDEDIPSLVMERYREGMFPLKYMGVLTSGRHFLHNQVEKSDERSAHACSHELRGIIYGIILKPMQGQEAEREGVRVNVWSRNRRNIKKSIVRPTWEPVDEYGELPRLDVLKEREIEERRQLLLIVLKANTARITSLPKRFQLFAASVRYWISNANPGVTKIWVKALLLGHLKLLAESEDAEKPPPEATDLRSDSDNDCQQSSGDWQTMPKASDSKKSWRSDFDVDCQHGFAQWQAVMMETIYLNQILLDPFDEPRISTLYNGVMAQSIAREIQQGKKIKSFVRTKDIFKQLYAAVKDGLKIDLPQEKGNNEKSAEPREHKTAKKRRDKKPPPVLDGNPFAPLCGVESEDES